MPIFSLLYNVRNLLFLFETAYLSSYEKFNLCDDQDAFDVGIKLGMTWLRRGLCKQYSRIAYSALPQRSD